MEKQQRCRRPADATSAALAAASAATAAEHYWSDLRLAVATYSLREFSREQAISIIRELGVKYVNVKSVHIPYYLSKQELTDARAELEKAGLEIVSGGNIKTLKKMHYQGVVSLEYEAEAAAPERGMDASLSYMRGLLDAQAGVA